MEKNFALTYDWTLIAKIPNMKYPIPKPRIPK